MMFDGAQREHQFVSDFLVGVALGYKMQHFQFALSEGSFAALNLPCHTRYAGKQARSNFRRAYRFPLPDELDSLHDLFR